MEKIKIDNIDTFYNIENIQNISEHIIKISFADEVPEDFGSTIHVYTSGNINYVDLSNFTTVYRIVDDKIIYLSNDASVYIPPQTTPDNPDIEVPPYYPTPEELLTYAQVAKKREVSNICEQMIYAGADVTFENGHTEHFSLTEHDQLNLFGKQVQLASGASLLEYHADGQPCKYYTSEDMQLIIKAAMWHVSYHTTYCNALNMWIAGCDTADEVNEIYYGAEIPDEYKNEVMTSYITQIANME